MEFWLAQIFGGIALILVCIGYFLKDKNKFMITQIISNFFYASAFFVVGAYVGGVIVMISIVRCLYIFIADKYSFKYKIHLLPIFFVLYMISTIILWESAFDIIPLIASCLFTIGLTMSNLQHIRYFLILPNAMLVLYNVLTTTYVSALLDFIEVIVIIVAIIKNYRSSKASNGN